MSFRLRAFSISLMVTVLGLSQTADTGPDPREIPLPRIQTKLGELPGVKELPVRKEMPDVLAMNDGTRVTTRQQWEKRRREMRRILSYYAVGQMPPPPGNVKGREVNSETQTVQESPRAQDTAMPRADAGDIGEWIRRIGDNQYHGLGSHADDARNDIAIDFGVLVQQPQAAFGIIAIGGAPAFSLIPAVIITSAASTRGMGAAAMAIVHRR